MQEGRIVRGPNGERGIIQNGRIVPLQSQSSPQGAGVPQMVVPPQPKVPPPRHPEQVRGDQLNNERIERDLNEPYFIPQGATHMVGADGRAVPIPGVSAETDPKAAAERRQMVAELDGVAKLLFEARQKFNKGLRGGMPGPIAGWLPTAENEAFNTAGAGITEAATTAFRQPGLGSQDRVEFEAKMRAYQPKSTSTDAANEERFNTILTRLNAKRAGLGLQPLSWEDEPKILGGGGFTDEHRQQILQYLPKAKSPEDLMEFARNISRTDSGATTIGNAEEVLKYIQGGGDPSQLKFEPADNVQMSPDFEILGYEDE